MSVATLIPSESKTSEQTELTINNNFKKLDIESESPNMHDDQISLNNGDNAVSLIKCGSERSSTGSTDDTSSSDCPLADKVSSDDVEFENELNMNQTNSVDYLKEKAIIMLQEELNNARKALELKDKECTELSSVRTKVEEELEELTASLFEEAHKMVHEANMKQFLAEKKLTEAQGEIEALQTEVSALKSLVLTSTPSNPNPQCHPQLIKKKKDVLTSPLRKHRLGRKKNHESKHIPHVKSPEQENKSVVKTSREIDTVIMSQLESWLKTCRDSPTEENVTEIDGTENNVSPSFLQKIEAEDVIPCLTFSDPLVSCKILDNVHNNTLTIELLPKPVIEMCALSKAKVFCKHQIKFEDSDKWLPISLSCRTRIATVCDYLTYIRYIEKKIVRHSRDQMYWEINQLRREMVLAKLGYYKEE